MATISKDGSLTFVRGDDVVIPLTFKAAGMPVNLTGYTFSAQIRTKPNAYVVLSLSFDLTNAATGIVIASASNALTKDIRVEEAFWDVQQIGPSGIVKTVIGPAAVTIIKDVTIL